MQLVTLTIYFSNGCATSEDIFWKLDALQNFVRDLHWPDPEFANHLNQRLKAMAADMIESSIHRSVSIISIWIFLALSGAQGVTMCVRLSGSKL